VLSPVTLAKAILPLALLQGAVAGVGLAVPQRPDSALVRLFPAQPTGYVTDVAGTLDHGSVEALNDLIERLRSVTGAEIAIAVLSTIGDRAPVDVAVAIGRAWGVGAKANVGEQRRNAGLVILLVPKRAGDDNSGQVFIATGNGLEGIVTDLQAGRVRDLMRPYFQRGEYGAGLLRGVRQLVALIASGMGVTDSALTGGGRQLEQPSEPSLRSAYRSVRSIGTLLFWLIVIVIVLFNAGRRGRRGWRGPGPWFFGGGGFGGGGFGGFGGGGGGGGFGGFGGGGGFSGGGAGGRF